MDPITEWAKETFSRAELGDQRLTARAVTIAESVARHPGGTVTSTMKTSAEKEGAYRFIENERVDPSALEEAVGTKAALACDNEEIVFVAMDQTDLTFRDRKGVRGLGPDGANATKTLRSTQVMSALAMTVAGVPLGVLDQQFWLRSDEKAPDWKEDTRPVEERESWWWIVGMRSSLEQARTHAPGTKPWFICDRGADSAQFLREVVTQDVLVTLRACQNRVIERNGKHHKLFSTLRRQPVLGKVKVTIPATAARVQRRATFEIRVLPDVRIRLGRRNEWAVFGALQLREISPVPSREEPVCWRLLTSHQLKTRQDALLVIHSYTCRWRVEEFHKAWKSGVCDVEASQLRSYDAIRRWAIILAAVAARAERLKRLSRESPDVDALTEFSQDELDAAIYYMEPKQWQPGDAMTLQEAVRLVAMAGGYMGRKGDGPPGSITIRRGLERVLPAAAVLRAQRRSG